MRFRSDDVSWNISLTGTCRSLSSFIFDSCNFSTELKKKKTYYRLIVVWVARKLSHRRNWNETQIEWRRASKSVKSVSKWISCLMRRCRIVNDTLFDERSSSSRPKRFLNKLINICIPLCNRERCGRIVLGKSSHRPPLNVTYNATADYRAQRIYRHGPCRPWCCKRPLNQKPLN